MSEAEYETLAEDFAVMNRLGAMVVVKPGLMRFDCDQFLAGVKFSRTHPPPEVQALVEAMSAAERVWRAEGATFLADRIKEVIARFKERSKG